MALDALRDLSLQKMLPGGFAKPGILFGRYGLTSL
jgi:hypothetical protein